MSATTKSSVRHADLQERIPVDFGREGGGTRLSSLLRREIEADQEVKLLDDVNGVQIYEDDGREVLVISAEGRGYVSAQADPFLDALREGLRGRIDFDNKTALAVDLVFLADFEGSPRARFLTLITALEVLSLRAQRAGIAKNAIDTMVKELQEEMATVRKGSDDAEQLTALLSGLKELQKESIGAAIRNLISSHAPAGQSFGGKPPGTFVNRCYAVRSKLVHDGREPADESVTDLESDLRRLVWAVVPSKAYHDH